ncbi:peptidase inhibitor family I36 protein (plasmid) [Streptomyces sp. BHT-5-2]|nr:peptidase inhibitor family I36 protein [Streptomyces sp. BHT-5-2]QZL09017.1 peptidase inhibitor family I36 protein [Streptomyces sp. BHT-5-2]
MLLNKTRALLVAGVAAFAGVAGMAPAQAVPGCGDNTVCLWTGTNGGGDIHTWTGGYQDLPANFHDHVYSFRANRNAAFINYNNGTKECRPVAAGDYADNYDRGFGATMDAIDDHC